MMNLQARRSHPLVTRVARTIRERGMIAPGERVLAAVSGGGDSVALALALRESGVETGICAIDHGLRPGASAEVEQVRLLASRLGVWFATRRVRVDPAGRGLEDAARRARYAAIEEIRATGKFDRIATGHTRTDQAETVLLRLVRGAGLRGLSGIPPVRARVVRPLIDLSRDQLRAFLRERGEPWVEDPHNQDLRFARVRLRQKVWPALLAMNPRLEEALAGLADRLRADADRLDAIGSPERDALALARKIGLDPDARAVARMVRALAAGRDPLREAYGRLPGGKPRGRA